MEEENQSFMDDEIPPDCPICYSKAPRGDNVLLPCCSCTFCKECMYNWYLSQSQEVSFLQDQSILCPNEKCRHRIPSESLLRMFHMREDSHYYNSLLDSLTRAYLTRTKDIRQCPNSLCKYSGIIEERQSCPNQLVCDICGHSWRDKLHLKQIERIATVYQSSHIFVDDLMTELYYLTCTEECPSCSIAISKNGGCPHMTCKKCCYEFCWYCKHRHKYHDNILCYLTIGCKIVTFNIFFLHTLILTNTLTLVSRIVGYLLRYLLYFALFNLVPVTILLFLLQLYSHYENKQTELFTYKLASYSCVTATGFYLLQLYELFGAFILTLVMEFLFFGMALVINGIHDRRIKYIL